MAAKRIPNLTIQKYAKTALMHWGSRLSALSELKKVMPAAQSLVVDLTVCTPAKMKEINLHYRGKNKPTDVLSFPASEYFWEQGMLGDLVLCGPVVVAQAREHNHSWKHEVDVLIVHGLLHLLGFDHEKGGAAAKKMAQLEAKILEKSGLIKRSRST